VPAASAHPTAAACGSVPQAEHSARARLDTLFAAIADQKPALARSVLALHRGAHTERFGVTLLIWHAGRDNVSHPEARYRAHRGGDRSFDAWVRTRSRHFAAVAVNGDYVHAGLIALSVSVDRSETGAVFHYGGKAVFDCVQNRYVFLQFGRAT
jgi:hypothetical protein